jgi:hypothetical protein
MRRHRRRTTTAPRTGSRAGTTTRPGARKADDDPRPHRLPSDERDPPGRHLTPRPDKAEREQGEALQDQAETDQVQRSPSRSVEIRACLLVGVSGGQAESHADAPQRGRQGGQRREVRGPPGPVGGFRRRRDRDGGVWLGHDAMMACEWLGLANQVGSDKAWAGETVSGSDQDKRPARRPAVV